jgi:D-alanyl-lipoteichoic acid acyltransferase DltB (MBOAT superfamily)
MALGMFKKVVIADRLAVYVNQVYNHPENYTGLPLILATIFFSFQIYCDFSGYSDIALGSARVMGFNLMKNFDRPYFSTSISEFWRRWHISLSTWFRDYLYIPLGGNKVVKSRWFFNLFFTFLVSGLWHGASWNFVIWGSLHGIFLILAIVFIKPIQGFTQFLENTFGKTLTWVFHNLWTFVLVAFAWVFFRAANFPDAIYIIQNFGNDLIFSIKASIFNTGNLRNHFLYVERNKLHFFFSISLIFFLLVFEYFQGKGSLTQYFLKKHPTFRWVLYFALSWLFLLLGMFQSKQQFTYFQF